MTRAMVVGVDFDNTIVRCDELFHRAALERELIPAALPATKATVRDFLRECGKEEAWTELQGYVYGVLIQDASPFPGVLDFFSRCKHEDISAYIISHKTRVPFLGKPFDLHQAAREWLAECGFHDSTRGGVASTSVFFEPTRQEKLDRIARMCCTHFIDDLPEFLSDPGFPPDVERILFDPNGGHAPADGMRTATSWAAIEQWLIGVSAVG